jgi:hypothetical protein
MTRDQFTRTSSAHRETKCAKFVVRATPATVSQAKIFVVSRQHVDVDVSGCVTRYPS